MNVRRVITGQDADGHSVFVSDEEVPGDRYDLFPGWEFHPLWGTDAPAVVPSVPALDAGAAYFPGPGAVRFSFSTVPPQTTLPPGDLDIESAAAEVEAGMPGLLAHMEADDPGMHTTDTIDLEVILSGEVILELDGGVERILRPGDTVVQTGVRHRWRNAGTEPCVMAIFMLGAERLTG
ncbi:MAG TPA: cupin domain-containing protein [Solirubrobacteraceae bacterium]|nr:cupin domain-containing protein [Solirubrobacteraceae bacterium]